MNTCGMPSTSYWKEPSGALVTWTTLGPLGSALSSASACEGMAASASSAAASRNLCFILWLVKRQPRPTGDTWPAPREELVYQVMGQRLGAERPIRASKPL